MEINGWKFNAVHGDSKWRPANPVIAYEVAGFKFLIEEKARNFARTLSGCRGAMISRNMDKRGAVIDVGIKEVEIKIRISAKTDPQLYTPYELVYYQYNNTPLPEGYGCNRICTHVEDE